MTEQGYQSSMTLLKTSNPTLTFQLSSEDFLILNLNSRAEICFAMLGQALQIRVCFKFVKVSTSFYVTCVCSLCSKSRKRLDTKRNVSHSQTFEFIVLSMHKYLQFLYNFLSLMGKKVHKFCKILVSLSLPNDVIQQIRSQLLVSFCKDVKKSKY